MASTVIGAGITIEGEITTDEDVLVTGTLRGKLTAKEAVTVEHGATVEADVTSASLAIAGSLTGNVVANERVDLQAGARVIGNVKAARVTIADGAQFKGNVDMDV
ncbi:MAG TPA: polymer-forming cytoskeletal protein [Polyangiaceae bacterium]|nr:polymer-forming cytoskeletal protein [Polyangiaceae bacterium]